LIREIGPHAAVEHQAEATSPVQLPERAAHHAVEVEVRRKRKRQRRRRFQKRQLAVAGTLLPIDISASGDRETFHGPDGVAKRKRVVVEFISARFRGNARPHGGRQDARGIPVFPPMAIVEAERVVDPTAGCLFGFHVQADLPDIAVFQRA